MDCTTPLNWHEAFIVHLAKLLRPKVYVELGLYQCTLFNQMIPYADQLIGVDLSSEAGSFMIRSPKVVFIHGTTADYAVQLNANPIQIDLLFIDANHSKESVLSDFNNFFPFIAPHGVILIHDTHWQKEVV